MSLGFEMIASSRKKVCAFQTQRAPPQDRGFDFSERYSFAGGSRASFCVHCGKFHLVGPGVAAVGDR